jgi:hypothetical protein
MQLLVEQDNSLPEAVSSDLVKLGGMWCTFSAQIAAEGRLGP